MATATELRLQQRNDALENLLKRHEDLLASRGDGELSDTDKSQLATYRSEEEALQAEIKELTADVERQQLAAEESRKIRRAGLEATGGDPDGPIYRTFTEYARDMLITGKAHGDKSIQLASEISTHLERSDVEAANARLELLKRTPANTLSSNVAGLQPPQHIAQIFQVIDTSRPLVASATRAELNRGTLTYPSVDTPPVVAVQSAEKTEAGNTGMAISMVTATASTYLGGGDLSWQAVNWSTPNALDLWFRLAAADYALKTEQDAAQVMQHSAFTYKISSTIAASATFATWMTGVGAGYAAVFANSGRTADTLYVAPDVFGYFLGLTSNAFTQFTSVNGSNIGPLNIVVSRGMDSGVAVIGDSEALLVAETPGAPVELRVTEPAIGGYEVGLIGAFEAAVVDPGAFSMITTAS